MMRTVTTDRAPAARGHYAQAVVHGDLIFVAGQLPLDPRHPDAPVAGFEAQARQAIANVLAIVEAAGGSADTLLRVTVYIADIALWPDFNRIYAEALGSHRPARTVVPVPGLHYGSLLEIDAIASVVPPIEGSGG